MRISDNFFEEGSAELNISETRETLLRLADFFNSDELKGRRFRIEGHTDNVPIHTAEFKDNNELSSFRALSVFNYLLEVSDLDPATLKHSGRGEYVPVADNSTPEGRAKNRRIEIKIYNTLSGE